MVNRQRGEVSLQADGRHFTLCLTLGALADLESAYGGEDILSLAARFSSGHLSASDALHLLRAGLKGGGEEVSKLDLEQMSFEGGMAGLIRSLADLLAVTFGSVSGKGADGATGPFPGSPS